MTNHYFTYEGRKRRSLRGALRRMAKRIKIDHCRTSVKLYDFRDVSLFKSSFIRGRFTCDDDKRVRF